MIIDKPGGMTSHDVVARMRRIAGTRRVGHGGTLDPMATGVLVLGIGQATKLLTYVTGCTKRYRATVRLGQATITDDAEGEVTAVADASGCAQHAILTALAAMTGEVDQVPSAVSAIKVKGVRSYARVRAGEQVALAARRVTISSIEVSDIRRPAPDLVDLDVEVECSAGTYIRAIARDLGTALGVGGHLTALRRTAVGGFTLAEATTLEALADGADPVAMSMAGAAARLMPSRDIDREQAGLLAHGGRLVATGAEGPHAAVDPDGTLVAVIADRDGKARSQVVFAAAS